MYGIYLPGRESELKFASPEKALYISHPLWNLESLNIIDEDKRFVMGKSHLPSSYVPIPGEIMMKSIGNLSERRALRIDPKYDLTESIDFDVTESFDHTFLLDRSGVLVRMRKDRNNAHTMMLLGEESSLVQLTRDINLPNPFNPKKYPYRELFVDESGAEGEISVLMNN